MKKFTAILGAAFILVTLTPCFAGSDGQAVPSKYMRKEHNEIYARIERLAQSPGKSGQRAKDVMVVLRPHMIREEQFVLPQLAVLKSLAFNSSAEGMYWVVKLSAKLKDEYPSMLSDHAAITKAADRLLEAAKLENDVAAEAIASQLKSHLQEEADIVYPAAILAGEHIKCLKKS